MAASTPTRLAGALQAVQAEHPLLRARVALAGGRPWFKPVRADAHPIPIERGGLRDWRARIEAQLERPFVDEAPLARFLLLRHRRAQVGGGHGLPPLDRRRPLGR